MLPVTDKSYLSEVLFFLIIFVVCSIETTTWYFLFPKSTLPTFWFVFVCYLAIYRRLSTFAIYSILLALIISAFSVSPLFNTFISILVSGVILAYLQSQFYVRDRLHFSAYSAICFFIYSFILNILNLNFYSLNFWIIVGIKSIFISFSALFIFPFCQFIDGTKNELSHREGIDLTL